jgi:hypothetical protein
MALYTLRIKELVTHTVTIEADDEDDAYDNGVKIISESEAFTGAYDTEFEGFTEDYTIELED